MIITSDLQTAFKDIDVALLMASVNAISRERHGQYDGIDSITMHIQVYKQHAEALNAYAKKTVKVLSQHK